LFYRSEPKITRCPASDKREVDKKLNGIGSSTFFYERFEAIDV